MLLAIDLDNTIICYDQLFVQVARERELVAPDFTGGKQALRDLVRQGENGEWAWQELQADVYGNHMMSARAYCGAFDFIRAACARDVRVAIVSHKTIVAACRPDGANLRAAAADWLRANGFIGSTMIGADDVYFETMRAAKIERIRSLGAQIVIDDLIEVFTDEDFPPGVRRWLFAPRRAAGLAGSVEVHAGTSNVGAVKKSGTVHDIRQFSSWNEMHRAFPVELGPLPC